MKKQRKHYTPEERVAILRLHLLNKEPISKLCDELGLQPTIFYRVSSRVRVERDRKLEEARKQRQIRPQKAARGTKSRISEQFKIRGRSG